MHSHVLPLSQRPIACSPHRPLDRRLWLPQFSVSFFPRLPGIQLPSSIPFFSVSLSLCFPLPACFKPQYRLQSLHKTPSQHPSASAPYLLASQPPRTATSLLTFLRGPGPPWSQKQRETEWHQANEQALRMWAGTGLHGPQTELSVWRRLKPRQPQRS